MFMKRIIWFYFIFTAIIPNEKWKGYLTLYHIAISIITISGMITATYSATKITYRTHNSAILLSIVCAALLQYCTRSKSQLILSVIDRMRGNSSQQIVHRAVSLESEARAEKDFRGWIIAHMLSNMWSMMTPMCYFFVKEEIRYDDPDLQSIPFLFSSWWKTDTLAKYAGMMVSQMVVGCTLIFAYWTFTIVVVYVAINIRSHARNIKTLFADCFVRNFKKYMQRGVHEGCDCFTMKYTNSKWRNEYDKVILEEIVELIRYHQFINEYVKDFKQFAESPFTIILIWFFSSNVLFCYTFLEINGDAIFTLKSLSLVIHDIIALHIFCLIAQSVNELNETIMDSFYFSEWYYLTPKLRGYLLTMLIKCQSQYKIKSFGMYIINLNLFLRAIRIVYSVLNVINVMRRE